MTREQFIIDLAVLGLSGDFTEADVRARHRAAIAKAHPDRGGTTYQAQVVNAARDRVLKWIAQGRPTWVDQNGESEREEAAAREAARAECKFWSMVADQKPSRPFWKVW